MFGLEDIMNAMKFLLMTIARLSDRGVNVKRIVDKNKKFEVVYLLEANKQKYRLVLNKETFTFMLFNSNNTEVARNLTSAEEILKLLSNEDFKPFPILRVGGPAKPNAPGVEGDKETFTFDSTWLFENKFYKLSKMIKIL